MHPFIPSLARGSTPFLNHGGAISSRFVGVGEAVEDAVRDVKAVGVCGVTGRGGAGFS